MKRHLHLLLVSTVILSGCYSQAQVASHWLKRHANHARGKCVAEGHLKVGNPYQIKGVTYHPSKTSYGYEEVGVASWYGSDFHAKATANGECYDMYAMTAAHKTLPLPTTVRVTNLKNGRSVVLKVNDRGPYAKGRIIDLSYAAAKHLGMAKDGISKVRVQAIGGPHHKPNGASKSTIMASRKRTQQPIQERAQQIQKSSTPYKLTDNLSNSKPATKKVTIAGSNVTARLNSNTHSAQPSFTERVSNGTPPTKKAPTSMQETIAPAAGAAKSLSIQFGSYNQHANALHKWEKTNKTFPSSKLVTTNINGTATHRVRIGPFKNQADASSALEKARSAGFNNAVIVIE